MSQPSTPRFAELDLLRVLAITYIVGFWHIRDYHEQLHHFFLLPGKLVTNLALATLFWMSGFLLANRYHFPGPTSPWRFYRSRLIRIYPLYAMAIVTFAVMGLLTSDEMWSGLLLTNAISGDDLRTLWFVTLIMVYYLITPLLLWRFQPIVFSAIAVLLCVATFYAHDHWQWFDLRLPLYLPAYLAGLFCARQTRLHSWWRHPVVSLAGIGVFWWLLTQGEAHDLLRYENGIRLFDDNWVIALYLLLIPGLWRTSESLLQFLPASLFQRLGYATFALYLVHRPVYESVAHWLNGANHWTIWAILTLAAFPLCWGLAWALQRAMDHGIAHLENKPLQP